MNATVSKSYNRTREQLRDTSAMLAEVRRAQAADSDSVSLRIMEDSLQHEKGKLQSRLEEMAYAAFSHWLYDLLAVRAENRALGEPSVPEAFESISTDEVVDAFLAENRVLEEWRDALSTRARNSSKVKVYGGFPLKPDKWRECRRLQST